MSKIAFKKGLLANLPATFSEGTFYVTTDERAMYLDVSDSARIRLGDFQEFATVAELEANANPSATALYYVTDINCLAKWDGSQYVQINRDTGMTAVEVVGDGNAVTAAVYSADGRKLTLTKGATYMTAADVDSKISAKVGDLGDKATVKAYVDAKTEGIASDEALTALSDRVTTAEGDIDALETKVGEKTVSAQIDEKITALDLANTYDPKGAADGKDAAIKAAQDAADAAQADVDALDTKVGTVAEGKTVVQMIEDSKYDDSALKTRISKNETDIATLNGDENTAGSVKKQVADAVAKIVADAPEAYDTLKEISDWISSHSSDASAMNSQINTNKSDIAALKALVGELPEGAEATTIVAYIQEVVDGLSIGDYAKAADLTAAVARIATLEGKAHEHSNKTVLDGITAAKVSAWDAAEQNAKDYADGLAGNYDAKGAAATAESNAKSYADSLASNYDAAGDADTAEQNAKDYADGLLTWGSF